MPESAPIMDFLAALKAEGRSSPAGMHWHQFYELLEAKRPADSPRPPKPFILAASGESDASKHQRLAAQLEWAHENGCLDEALGFLKALPHDRWNRGPRDRWHQDSYFK